MTINLADILKGVEEWTDSLEQKALAAMEAVMTALENWAKTEHSYTDRTGNLTNSIRGFVESAIVNGVLTGTLTATMEYAVFVELARSGKWAFLQPTIERHEADILKLLGDGMK